MIPSEIERVHIIRAIEKVNKEGIPKGRSSMKFLLEYHGKAYPPKYIVSLAWKYVKGVELDPSRFGGGQETNIFLKRLGFNIVNIPYLKTNDTSSSPKIRIPKLPRKRHSESCLECKSTIEKMLKRIYGNVEINFKLGVSTNVEDYKKSPFYRNLKKIFITLQRHRGYKDFVRSAILPPCDYFVRDPGFIIEFDESQHFTLPRKAALENYPKEQNLGFDKNKWKAICKKNPRRDNDPPFRDEQRAWYDTLRDFLTLIKGLEPTIRLHAGDFEWCRLNPNNPDDVKIFEGILKQTSRGWEIEINSDPNPYFARIIIADEWQGNSEESRNLLESIYRKWPKGRKVKFIMTCGAFIQFEWPKYISRHDIGDNKYPNSDVVSALVQEAEKCARFVLNDNLVRKFKEYTDYITLGVDSYKDKISTTGAGIHQLHIELIFLVNLRDNKFYWTGKSYPTSRQQPGLIRISNLRKHFFDLDDIGKIMIIGCHDLTVFNPRSKNSTGWRKEVNREFKEIAKKEKPIYVLHHPHTTVKARTWLNAWNGLRKTLPSVKKYFGAGRYQERDRDRLTWDNLEAVLESTKSDDTIDFIVNRE